MSEATKLEMIYWDHGIRHQYLDAGGFCEYCSEACKPFSPKLPQELKDTACEYNGAHPMCDGNHQLVLEGKTPEVFGGYEMYACINPGCTYMECL